jgi:hypothetical protein
MKDENQEAGAALPIVERLRRSVTDTTAFCPTPSYRNPDGPEAADTIEELVEALKGSREYVADALEAHEHSDGRELLASIDALLAKLEAGDTK